MKTTRLTAKNLRRTLATLCLAVCAIAQVQAQDLYNDMGRYASNGAISAAGSLHSTAFGSGGYSYFRTGTVEYPTQPLEYDALSAFVNSTSGAADPDVIGTFGATTALSGVFWNCHTTSFTLPDGVTISPKAVTLESNESHSAAVEIDMPKDTTNSFTVHTAATSTFNSSTLQLYTLSEGVWTLLFSEAMTSPRSDTRTFTATHDMRLRWVLEGGGGSVAASTLSVVITK